MKDKEELKQMRKKGIYYYLFTSENIWKFALIWNFINLIWFAFFWYIRYNQHLSNPVGRALGHVNSLNLGALLLPISRNSVIFRIIKIPFEKALFYHRILARIFFITVFLHGISWYIYWAFQVGEYPDYHLEWGLPDDQNQALSYHFLKTPVAIFGNIAFVLTFIQFIISMERFRRRDFELFYYTHHIFVLIVIFSLLHTFFQTFPWSSDQLIYYLLPGILLYIVDRINRLIRSHAIKTDLLSLEPMSDLSILMLRRQKFKFQPGQYCFLCIPSISRLQWHPYSISSTPDDKFVSFHIKSIESVNKKTISWSKKIYQRASNQATMNDGVLSFSNALEVKIDGPYGVGYFPASKTKNLVFVCGGIGATPVVSIVQSLINNCQVEKDIHFIWVVSTAKHLTWFSDFLEQLLILQESNPILINFPSPVQEFELIGEDIKKSSKLRCNVQLFVTRNFNDINEVSIPSRSESLNFEVYPNYSTMDSPTRTPSSDNEITIGDDFGNAYGDIEKLESQIIDRNPIKFNKGRPNIDNYFKEISKYYAANSKKGETINLSTLVCGPVSLELDVLLACDKYTGRLNNNRKIKFHYTSQTFIL